MRDKFFILMLVIGIFCFASPLIQADALSVDGLDPVKTDITQPYVVKQGDTLWDIADHFFKNPMTWLKIWERNLYITNPDLIYPGKKIWFDGQRMQMGGLTTVKPTPQVIIKPVERLEARADASIMLTALARQDFIHPDHVQGVGHVLDSQDERLNFGANDRVYVKLNQPAKIGSLFDVFRSTDVIRDPDSGEAAGVLVAHLGQIKITSAAAGIHRAIVVKAFEEISRGDRLKPAKTIDPHIIPSQSERALSGTVMYIRNNAHEAAQNQVVGISLGLNDGLKAGTVMAILKTGRVVSSQVDGGNITLPAERIGELLVLVPQQQASIALITQSTAPINIGDSIQTITIP